MANDKIKENVNGGAGGSRWIPRADAKKSAKKRRRVTDKKTDDDFWICPKTGQVYDVN